MKKDIMLAGAFASTLLAIPGVAGATNQESNRNSTPAEVHKEEDILGKHNEKSLSGQIKKDNQSHLNYAFSAGKLFDLGWLLDARKSH